MNNTKYEWMTVIHSACSGQGCTNCRHTGEETIRINHEEQAA